MNDLLLCMGFACFFAWGWVSASWWITRRHREELAGLLHELDVARTKPETLR